MKLISFDLTACKSNKSCKNWI